MLCLSPAAVTHFAWQVPHIITHLFPELFKVFISADVYPKTVSLVLSVKQTAPSLCNKLA